MKIMVEKQKKIKSMYRVDDYNKYRISRKISFNTTILLQIVFNHLFYLNKISE